MTKPTEDHSVVVKEVRIVDKDFSSYQKFSRTTAYGRCAKCNSLLIKLYDANLSISAEKAVPYWGTVAFGDDSIYIDYHHHFPCDEK